MWMIGFLEIIYFGTMRNAATAWAMGDIGVGLMAWFNIIAILLMTRPALRCLRDYEAQSKTGEAITWDPKRIDLEDSPAWSENSA